MIGSSVAGFKMANTLDYKSRYRPGKYFFVAVQINTCRHHTFFALITPTAKLQAMAFKHQGWQLLPPYNPNVIIVLYP